MKRRGSNKGTVLMVTWNKTRIPQITRWDLSDLNPTWRKNILSIWLLQICQTEPEKVRQFKIVKHGLRISIKRLAHWEVYEINTKQSGEKSVNLIISGISAHSLHLNKEKLSSILKTLSKEILPADSGTILLMNPNMKNQITKSQKNRHELGTILIVIVDEI